MGRILWIWHNTAYNEIVIRAEIQLLNLGGDTVINCDKFLRYFFRRSLIFVQSDLTFERPKWISVLSDFVCFVIFSKKKRNKKNVNSTSEKNI